jgi:type III secretory pathway component EscS
VVDLLKLDAFFFYLFGLACCQLGGTLVGVGWLVKNASTASQEVTIPVGLALIAVNVILVAGMGWFLRGKSLDTKLWIKICIGYVVIEFVLVGALALNEFKKKRAFEAAEIGYVLIGLGIFLMVTKFFGWLKE